MSDYHLHLHPHGGESGGPPVGEYPTGLIESYLERAGSRGVTEIGFTEHLYRCSEGAEVLGAFWGHEERLDLAEQAKGMVAADAGLSLERYVQTVLDAKQRGLPVRLGLEVDFFPQTIDAVMELLDQYPFDYLIGSVHWIAGWSIDAHEVAYEFERRGIDQAWEEYFDLVADLARRGVVDVLAHVDVCKKFGYRPEVEPIHLYERVIRAALSSGTAVEVSSQGLRRPAREVYPSPTFLKMFHDAGIKITLASDGHRAEEAGWGHDEVVAAATAAGYDTQLRFEDRRPFEVPLTSAR
ncbi:MAG: histidinol-phosphatase [Acidimicrobiia bacterium]